MRKVFIWQRSDGWAWQTEHDAKPHGHGFLLKEWAVEDAETTLGKIEVFFTNPAGVPSLNA